MDESIVSTVFKCIFCLFLWFRNQHLVEFQCETQSFPSVPLCFVILFFHLVFVFSLCASQVSSKTSLILVQMLHAKILSHFFSSLNKQTEFFNVTIFNWHFQVAQCFAQSLNVFYAEKISAVLSSIFYKVNHLGP